MRTLYTVYTNINQSCLAHQVTKLNKFYRWNCLNKDMTYRVLHNIPMVDSYIYFSILRLYKIWQTVRSAAAPIKKKFIFLQYARWSLMNLVIMYIKTVSVKILIGGCCLLASAYIYIYLHVYSAYNHKNRSSNYDLNNRYPMRRIRFECTYTTTKSRQPL